MAKRNNSVPQEDGPVSKHFKVDNVEGVYVCQVQVERNMKIDDKKEVEYFQQIRVRAGAGGGAAPQHWMLHVLHFSNCLRINNK